MATWPATLPAPLVSGYALNPVDPSIRTDMEFGAARARRRTTARNDKLQASWIFSDAQMAIFRAWFDDGTTGAAGGAAWFTALLAIGTGGKVSTDTRIVGGFKAARIDGGNWQVSAELEIR